jgi:hypothetical protein
MAVIFKAPVKKKKEKRLWPVADLALSVGPTTISSDILRYIRRYSWDWAVFQIRRYTRRESVFVRFISSLTHLVIYSILFFLFFTVLLLLYLFLPLLLSKINYFKITQICNYIYSILHQHKGNVNFCIHVIIITAVRLNRQFNCNYNRDYVTLVNDICK